MLILPRAALSQAVPADSNSAKSESVDPRAVQPERPTVATHAYTVAPGYAEIEAGAQVARPGKSEAVGVPILLKIGLTPSLQFDLAGGYARNVTGGVVTSGQSDLAVALKQTVIRAAPVIQDFAVQATVKFPSGASGLTTKTTDLSLLLISSRMIGAAELDLNAGYTRRSGDGSVAPVNSTLVTASLGFPVFGAVAAVAEMFAYPATSGPSGTGTAVGSVLGFTLQPRKWLVLDAGFMPNIRNMGANAVFAGLTYNAGRIPGFPAPATSR